MVTLLPPLPIFRRCLPHVFFFSSFFFFFANCSTNGRTTTKGIVIRHLLSQTAATDLDGRSSHPTEEAPVGLLVSTAAASATTITTTTTTPADVNAGGDSAWGGIWPRNHFEGVNYLIRYGYLHPGYGWFLGNTEAKIELQAALQRYQRVAGITVTGFFDENTFKMMRKKRCGVPDMNYAPSLGLREAISPRRKRRFALQGSKWKHREITYKVSDYPQNLSHHDVDATINAAFKVWSNITFLQFTWKPRDIVDINIRFLSGNHGDGMPFDGPDGITAHAFFPNSNNDDFDGDIHFDAEENWVLSNKADQKSGQISLLCQAIHQIGHSLGLFHSESISAQMWPYIMECNGTSVHADDIQALQSLYSPSEGIQTAVSSNMSTNKDENFEDDHSGSQGSSSTTVSSSHLTSPSMSAGDRFWWTHSQDTQTERQTYPYWYRFSRLGPSTTSPSALLTSAQTTVRPKYCDGRLDAITVATDHLTYGFRDELVFRFNQINVDYTFPKKIQEVFPRGPLSVDAAVTFSKNRKKAALGSTYLIKGNLVWRYRHTEDGFQLEHFYPKPWAKEWDVTGTKIESAFKLGRKIYLLIDNRIWLLKGKKSRQRKYEKKRIKLFNQLPDFQAAVQWINRNTYFFTGNEYYRADLPAQRRRYVLNGPRDTAYWWFGCNEIPHIRQPFEDKDDNGWDLELTK
ncbi:collagenase 3-like [Octopus sinensis]|uniref:Collagenase 3-like n=2 Tax=Octopus sinensis TaxID=2607531 RepID=A0A6P7THQ4_9MOLL|nr:collagenase 3-like [Octopus sinensis]